MTRHLTTALTLLILTLSASCAPPRQEPAAVTSTTDWFERQRRTHAAVDRAIDRAETNYAATAINQLKTSIADTAPDHVPKAVVQAAHKDAYFRIADLHHQAGNHQAAIQSAEQGLTLNRSPDVFTVNLMLIRGQALRDTGESEAGAAQLKVARELASKLVGR